MKTQPQLDYYEMGAGIVAFSSTRHGGCSKGNYASFNINRYCGDDDEDIRKNREVLCETLGITDDRLIMPHQVHETKVANIDEAFLALNAVERQKALEGVDALMTNQSGVCIGVSTADCIPVLLCDHEHQAVCAIHAGWRGTVKRIVMKAVEAMTEAYGTRPQQLVAQIGPGIHLDSFEVGDEVYEAFAKEGFPMEQISKKYPSDSGSKFFIFHFSLFTYKWHIDLPACNRLQLMAAGLSPKNISVSPVCTFQQAGDYFSARRLGINSGRIFTGIIRRQS
jgi:YfiH family protein